MPEKIKTSLQVDVEQSGARVMKVYIWNNTRTVVRAYIWNNLASTKGAGVRIWEVMIYDEYGRPCGTRRTYKKFTSALAFAFAETIVGGE